MNPFHDNSMQFAALARSAVLLRVGLLVLVGQLATAEEPPWSLERARERICSHRMSDATVELVLPDGSPPPAETEVRVSFRGFHGAYEVWAVLDGHEFRGTFHLDLGGVTPPRVELRGDGP